MKPLYTIKHKIGINTINAPDSEVFEVIIGCFTPILFPHGSYCIKPITSRFVISDKSRQTLIQTLLKDSISMLSTTQLDKIFTKKIKPAIDASEQFMISQASFVYDLPKNVKMTDPREDGQWATVSSQLTISDRIIIQIQCLHSLKARLTDEGLAIMVKKLQKLLQSSHLNGYNEDEIYALFLAQSSKLFSAQLRIQHTPEPATFNFVDYSKSLQQWRSDGSTNGFPEYTAMYVKQPPQLNYLIDLQLNTEFMATAIASYISCKFHAVICGAQENECGMQKLARSLQAVTPIGLLDHVDFQMCSQEELLINGANVQLFSGSLGVSSELLHEYCVIDFVQETVQVINGQQEIYKAVKDELFAICYDILVQLERAGLMHGQAIIDEFLVDVIRREFE